ncbi:MAG: hypothetical protein ABJI69_00935 [Balneola sp.]
MEAKAIILGCPFDSLKDLYTILKERASLEVLNIQDIRSFNQSTEVIKLKNGKSLSIQDVKCSFIRYPYDLIPPHNETFELRERTEFLKSIGLLLNTVSVNAIQSTWMLRNRLFSLIEARKYGADVPNSELYQHVIKERNSESRSILKAIGNCFVNESQADVNNTLLSFLRKETDGEDMAFILPANFTDCIDIETYVEVVGVAFTQEAVISEQEYRGYLVGDRFFQYKRASSKFVDRSTSDYLSTSHMLSQNNQKALRSLVDTYNLGYLCFDFIHKDGIDYIVDINPYGSMPNTDSITEVHTALAELMINKATK